MPPNDDYWYFSISQWFENKIETSFLFHTRYRALEIIDSAIRLFYPDQYEYAILKLQNSSTIDPLFSDLLEKLAIVDYIDTLEMLGDRSIDSTQLPRKHIIQVLKEAVSEHPDDEFIPENKENQSVSSMGSVEILVKMGPGAPLKFRLPIDSTLIKFISPWTSEDISVQEALNKKVSAYLGSKD
jgi:hypothetical protein